ncbi:hypothetical protein [Vibrio owensii]|uniref:hypothetical protein n=1 Tax=Vibrio owensii TaxID=696485 RepID=UPI0018F109F6|nr:hypothetical protein [Vibrio owensii]
MSTKQFCRFKVYVRSLMAKQVILHAPDLYEQLCIKNGKEGAVPLDRSAVLMVCAEMADYAKTFNQCGSVKIGALSFEKRENAIYVIRGDEEEWIGADNLSAVDECISIFNNHNNFVGVEVFRLGINEQATEILNTYIRALKNPKKHKDLDWDDVMARELWSHKPLSICDARGERLEGYYYVQCSMPVKSNETFLMFEDNLIRVTSETGSMSSGLFASLIAVEIEHETSIYNLDSCYA